MDNPNDVEFKVPPTYSTDPTKKNWFSSHMILGVAFLVVVIAAIVAGIYYWQTVRVIPSSVQVPIHKDETANWKVYTNAKFAYSFKYPANLYLEEDSDRVILKSSSFPTNQIYNGGGVAFEGVEGKDWVRGYIIGVTNEIKNPLLTSHEDVHVEKMNLGSLETYLITCDCVGPSEILIKNPSFDNSYLEIAYTDGLATQQDSQIANKLYHQILSTFKFTNQAICAQVITKAKNTKTGEVKDFPTPCDVPVGWQVTEQKVIQTQGTLAGHVSIGPICPVEQIDNPCQPTAEMYTAETISVYASDGKTRVAQKNLDAKGNYSMMLNSGDYMITVSPAGMRQSISNSATVLASKTTTLNFDIDTGIR